MFCSIWGKKISFVRLIRGQILNMSFNFEKETAMTLNSGFYDKKSRSTLYITQFYHSKIITARKRSLRMLCFHRCLSVSVQGGCMRALGACMGGHAWQGSCVTEACVAGEMATAAGRTHPTGMHSCFAIFLPKTTWKWKNLGWGHPWIRHWLGYSVGRLKRNYHTIC